MAPPSTQPSILQRSSSTCLPFDVLTVEILPRLPVTSLLRFKTVCKLFKTVISSSDFADLHLRMCKAPENQFIADVDDSKHRHFGGFHYFGLHSLSAPSATFRWKVQSRVNYLYSVVSGSCNGLLLIKSSRTLKLLNPATRTYIDVSLDDPHAACDGHSTFGFGFDYGTNDYKIVKVCTKCSETSPERITLLYSVNSKTWTSVDGKCPSDSHYPVGDNGVLINNHLIHWMLYPRSGYSSDNIRLGCFDIYTEKWKDDILFPDCYYNRSPYGQAVLVTGFGVLEGSLYIVLEECKDCRYDMWVMKEHGVQKSWVKLFSIPVAMFLCLNLFGIASRGQDSNEVLHWQRSLIPGQRYAGRMNWYNVKDNVCNYESESPDPHFDRYQPYRCNASLVNLPGAKRSQALW